MKWIFLTLLFANLAFFGYQWRNTDGDVRPQVGGHPEASSEGGVFLLSERSGQSDRFLEAERVLENPVVETSTVDEPTAERMSQPAAGQRADEIPEETVIAGVTAADPVVRSDVSPPSDDLETSETVDSPGPAATLCWQIGAFEALELTQDMAERLSAVDVDVEIKAVDAPTGEYDYRVVILPMPSMQEAFRRLRELKSRNIDSYVMAQGENARGISLGLFSTQTAAQRHQQSMSASGYDSEILSIPRVSRGYWLYTQGGVIPGPMMQEIRSSAEGIELSETACLN